MHGMIFLPEPAYPVLFHLGSIGLVLSLMYLYGRAAGFFK